MASVFLWQPVQIEVQHLVYDFCQQPEDRLSADQARAVAREAQAEAAVGAEVPVQCGLPPAKLQWERSWRRRDKWAGALSRRVEAVGAEAPQALEGHEGGGVGGLEVAPGPVAQRQTPAAEGSVPLPAAIGIHVQNAPLMVRYNALKRLRELVLEDVRHVVDPVSGLQETPLDQLHPRGPSAGPLAPRSTRIRRWAFCPDRLPARWAIPGLMRVGLYTQPHTARMEPVGAVVTAHHQSELGLPAHTVPLPALLIQVPVR
mmetsp:Transcript_52165/g.93057  ORF Transcript_52165/g.93057 Transcript_52165/m.93057 type:complete len:259 (+) Transcript_52165:959-1735(+)